MLELGILGISIIVIIIGTMIMGTMYLVHNKTYNITQIRNLLDLITVLASNDRATIVADGYTLVDTTEIGLSVVVLTRSYPIYVKDIHLFNIQDIAQVFEFRAYVDLFLTPQDIVIIASCHNAFSWVIKRDRILDVLLSTLKKLGATQTNFRTFSNYVLIGSKDNKIYSEMLDTPIAYHPQFQITQSFCKQNPDNIYPPKSYLFFTKKVPDDEALIRCALERSARSTPAHYPSRKNKFALGDNDCILIENKNMNILNNNTANSDDCFDGVGSLGSISLYELKKVHNVNIQVQAFEFIDYGGQSRIINNDEYQVNKNLIISSIKIPASYYVHFSYINNRDIKLVTLYGPSQTPIIKQLEGNYKLDKVLVTHKYPNSVIFSDGHNCFVLAPGSYILPNYLYMYVNYVIISQYTVQVVLFRDISFKDIIQTLTTSGQVTYPKITRAIKIL